MAINEFTDGELITASRMNEIVGASNSIGFRIDNTVGKRVFITDGTTEHMVRGDTGWRELKAELINGWVGKSLLVRRVNSTVKWAGLNLEGDVASGPIIVVPPAGFGPSLTQLVLAVGMEVPLIASDSKIDLRGTNRYFTGAYSEFSYTTNSSWPTALPGSPYGTIPY